MSKITELVWQMAEPVAQRHGCTIWDVEFVKEAGERFLPYLFKCLVHFG